MNDPVATTPAPDHLQVLALRSMHAESMLQPRRASLFEGEASGLVEEASEFVAGQLLASARPEARQAERPALTLVKPDTSLPSSPVDDVEEPEERRPLAPAASREYVPVVREITPPIPAAAAETVEPVTALTADTGFPPLSSPTAPRVQTHSSVRVERLIATIREARVAEPAQAAEAVQEPPPARPSMASERRTVSAVEPPKGIMVAHAVPEMRGITPLIAAPWAKTQREEPAVEISIGRLEIRAAAPAPAQRTPVNTQPQQRPLKDYLSRRTGGSR